MRERRDEPLDDAPEPSVGGLSEAERPLGSSAVPTAQMIGGAVGAAGASALAGRLGLADGVDPATGPAAGLKLFGAMIPVASYYPSPAAKIEYLYSFVALCDLPDGAAGVFGVEGEAEDIRGHLIPFDRLMALVASGEVGNAPLILTALWLQRERPRLRDGVSPR